jgi:Glycosyl transferase family 2
MELDQYKRPFFSIIIATFNAEKTLKRCLNNIFKQRFVHKEILIQDGGSTDKTKSIIETYRNDIDYFDSYPDKGIYDAWNRALHHARGEWICFLGADDYFLDQNILQNYFEFLKVKNSEKNIVYGINHIVNSKGDLLYTIGKHWHEVRDVFYKTMCLPHPGLMHHRSIFDEYGMFDSNYKIAGDYELLLRALKVTPPTFYPHPVCATPIGGISTLPKNNIVCLYEIRRAKLKNGMEGICLLWVIQLISAIIRLAMWHTIGEKKSRYLLDGLRKIRKLDPFWFRAM